jgi:hypothetical protein
MTQTPNPNNKPAKSSKKNPAIWKYFRPFNMSDGNGGGRWGRARVSKKGG